MGDTTKGQLYAEQIARMWFRDLSDEARGVISGHDLDALCSMFGQAIDQDPGVLNMLDVAIAAEERAANESEGRANG